MNAAAESCPVCHRSKRGGRYCSACSMRRLRAGSVVPPPPRWPTRMLPADTPIPDLLSRFAERQPDGCLYWTACRTRPDDLGYGLWRHRRVHRLVWEYEHGPIPTGLKVLHECDHPPCCELAHLSLGTSAQNSAEMVARGRSAVGERHGMARLNDADVIEARALHAAGVKCAELASRFGVNYNTMLDVLLRRTWIHV